MRKMQRLGMTVTAGLLAGAAAIVIAQPASACGMHTAGLSAARVQVAQMKPTSKMPPYATEKKKPSVEGPGSSGNANGTGGANGSTTGSAGTNGSAAGGNAGASGSAGASGTSGGGAGAGGTGQ